MEKRNEIPGWEGSVGPFPSQYNITHVYARDINSGAGNCVCSTNLGDDIHIQVAPGIDVPVRYRSSMSIHIHASENHDVPHFMGSDTCLCLCLLCVDKYNHCICPNCYYYANEPVHYHPEIE